MVCKRNRYAPSEQYRGNNIGREFVPQIMKRFAAAITLSAGLFAQAQRAPERTVHGTILISDQSPPIRIALPTNAKYLGADRWPLYGVADCEVHLWVEADTNKVVSKLYWVQFEAYLPSHPESRYNYPFKQTTNIGGFDFDVRARFGPTNSPPKPESDGAHVRTLLEKAGYQWPPEMMNVRFVHVPDEKKRTELMIIYAEDLHPTGVKAVELEPGGKASAQWSALEQGLIERASQKLQLSRPSSR